MTYHSGRREGVTTLAAAPPVDREQQHVPLSGRPSGAIGEEAGRKGGCLYTRLLSVR